MKLPAMTEVKSSNIQAVGYHDGQLFVRFHGGTLYSYKGVDKKLFDGLAGAESAGSYFREHVRGKFTHQKHDG